MRKIFNCLNFLLFKSFSKKNFIEPKNIILVSNTALGDTILSTPAIKSVRLNFPDANIVLLVHKKLHSFFQKFEFVNQVEVFSSGLMGLTKQGLYFRKNNFDTILFIHSNGPQDLYLAMISGANNILKAINYPARVSKEFEKIMFNEIDYINTKHIIEHRLDLVRCFNPNKLDKSMSIASKYYLGETNNQSNIIALQLSAAHVYKAWPLSNFLVLMKKIAESLKNNCKIILLGIESEISLAKNFEEVFKYPHLLENLCGKTSTEDLQAILQKSSLLITNDTGTLHLAVAVKTPTISLFSPTDPKIFGPYQDLDRHKIVFVDGSYINDLPIKQRSQEAMSLISVEDVFEVFQELKEGLFICAE